MHGIVGCVKRKYINDKTYAISELFCLVGQECNF